MHSECTYNYLEHDIYIIAIQKNSFTANKFGSVKVAPERRNCSWNTGLIAGQKKFTRHKSISKAFET